MRLIDAEELLAKVNKIKYLRKLRAKMLCDECREVKAIPVEWLRKYVDEHDEIVEEGLYWIVEEIIDEWREENGTDRQE